MSILKKAGKKALNRYRAWRCCAVIHPEAAIEADGSIQNILKDRNAIRIGAFSTVLGRLLTYGHGGNIVIGDYCFVGLRTEIWSMESITIGNRVLISHDVNIHDGTGHSHDAAKRHAHYKRMITSGHPRSRTELPGLKAAPIIIEDDVWISFGATILQGVRIGRGSVIAAGSVVTDDVPPDSIYRCKIFSEVKKIPA